MSDQFQASYDASQRMARVHTDIAADVDDLAGTMPTSLDGGEGTEFILNALAAIADATGQVSQVNQSAAGRLRDMVDLVRGVDASAEGDFRELEKQVD